MRTRWWMFLSVLGGCSNDPTVQKQSQMVAVVGGGTAITVAYGDPSHAQDLQNIVSGVDQPKTFHWASVSVPTGQEVAVRSANGFSTDLTIASGVTFTQVYQGACNPANSDFNDCWLFESYTGGQDGLTGTISLRLGDTQAEGHFDVTWQGITDRFGPPQQWHKHGTMADYLAQLATPAPGGAQ